MLNEDTCFPGMCVIASLLQNGMCISREYLSVMWIVAIEPIRIRAASIKLCDWLNDGRKPCRQQFFAHLYCQEYYPFVLVRGGSDFGC